MLALQGFRAFLQRTEPKLHILQTGDEVNACNHNKPFVLPTCYFKAYVVPIVCFTKLI